MVRSSRKAISVFLALSIVFMLLMAGCGQNAKTDTATSAQTQVAQTASTSAEPAKAEEPYSFSIFRSTWTDLNAETDPVIQAINKKLNVKINILTSPYETWEDKINLLISSGDVPDIVVHTGPGTGNYSQWAQDGIFLDLTDLYPKYTNLTSNIPQKTVDSLKINNKIFFVPCPYLVDAVYNVRADWLKKVGITINNGEVTLDEFYNILKAFTLNDPDGDGKNNTYGMLGEDTLTFLEFVRGAFGVDGFTDNGLYWYKDTDGQYKATFTQPGWKDMIKWVNKIYKEKLLDPEWMLTKSQAIEDKFNAGKAGVTAGYASTIISNENSLKAGNPNGELEIITKITGPGKQTGFGRAQQFWMGSSISAKAANPQKLLEFLDYCVSPEGKEMLKYGIEGVTYQKKDGKNEIIADAYKKYGYEQNAGHYFTMMLVPAQFNLPDTDRGNKYKQMISWYSDIPAYDAPLGELPSQKSYITAQGTNMITKAVTEMIIGKVDVDTGYDKLVQNWMSAGGEQLTKEVNELAVKQGK